jgi:hypothetical protein
LSTNENPGNPSLTPQIKDPRALISARVGDDADAEEARAIANRNVEKAHRNAVRPYLTVPRARPMVRLAVDLSRR